MNESPPSIGNASPPGVGKTSRGGLRRLAALVVGLGVTGLFTWWLFTFRVPGAGNQSMYEPIATALGGRGRVREQRQLAADCSRAPRCECLQLAARAGLDHDLPGNVLDLLARQPAECQLGTRGIEAEALVRVHRQSEALPLIEQVLSSQPNEPYANYARAEAAYGKRDLAGAEAAARQAVTGGRGARAHQLLGLVALYQGNLARAKTEFEEMLKSDPNDSVALYNLAWLAHRQNRYRDAREGYLSSLRADPQNLDARYNLALLVHAAGATLEARHHLEQLRAVAPAGDQRVNQLEQTLRLDSTPVPSASVRAPVAVNSG
jgi:tetratricopeptide (TPR) repeat protein